MQVNCQLLVEILFLHFFDNSIVSFCVFDMHYWSLLLNSTVQSCQWDVIILI